MLYVIERNFNSDTTTTMDPTKEYLIPIASSEIS